MRFEREGGAAGAETEPPAERESEWMEALPAPRRGREVWVGVFVVAAVLATLTALFTLTDAGMFRGRYETQVRVAEASGIRRGDPVQMRGVNIGRVKAFQMDGSGVLVRLEIEGEYPVPRDSRVELVSDGLLGGMSARVRPGSSPERAGRGDVLPGSVSGGMLAAAEGVGTEAELALQRVQSLLSPQTVDAVGDGAVQLRELLVELSVLAAEEGEALQGLTASLRRTAEGLESATAGPELARIIERLDALALDASATARSSSRAAESLEVVLGRLERGEGTLGRLSTDPALYEDMQSALAGITALVDDIRTDPRRYIDLRIF